jgi:secondary thiamine-phosphate synthase enzyme
LLVQHTSASLTIQENADPSARHDLENFLNRLVPENDPLYTHTMEGADDMPAHIKAALTSATLSIPVTNGQLMLGTWQGIYLWEHRNGGADRHIAIHVGP